MQSRAVLSWVYAAGALLLAAALPAQAQSQAQSRRADAPIFGTGSMVCQQAVAPDQIARAREWLNGYLTAFGESFGPPSIWLGDPETVSTLFDETCAAFPKFTLVEAARWVILALQDRRYNKRK